jgi:hypothetical protein
MMRRYPVWLYRMAGHMKKHCTAAICSAMIGICAFFIPGNVHGADLSIGASVWYSWWDPYWSQVSDTVIFPDTKLKFGVLPRIKLKSDFSGGPLLSISVNDTWGLSASYAYGVYKGTVTSFLLNPLYYFIEQPVNTKREARRHEFSFFVTGRINNHVNLFGGVAYTGYLMHTDAEVFVPEQPFYYSYSHTIFHHFAGPEAGAYFTVPIVSTLYLLPGISCIFQFSSFAPEKRDFISDLINSLFMGKNTTLMYAGLNLTLSLAYYIRQANVTLALGGRFRYLWITDIDEGNFVADGDHEMFGGINLVAVYTFSLTGSPDRKKEDPPLPRLQ